MDPRDFLSLAEVLVIQGPRAANLRSATSRAYYATHLVGSEILEKLTFKVPRNQHAHNKVIELLQNAGEEDVQIVASQLQDLYAARRRADYDMNNVATEKPETVRAHVAQAKKMIVSLTACLTEPKRSKIIASIRSWNQRQALFQQKPPTE